MSSFELKVGSNHIPQLEVQINQSVNSWATTVSIASIALSIVALIGLIYCIYDIFMAGLEMQTVIELAMYTAVAVVSFIGFVASQNRGIDSTRTYYRAIFFLMIFFLAGYGSVSYLNY